jgi:Tfp pilus assembly protein PilV
MMFLKNKKKGRCGFTLVEVLIGVYIMAFGVLGVLLTLTKTSAFMSAVRQNAIATHAAQEEIEKIRAMDFTSLLSQGPSFTASAFNELKNATGTLTVENIFSSNDIRRVTVLVSWSGLNGQPVSKSLSTLVTRSGINKQ